MTDAPVMDPDQMNAVARYFTTTCTCGHILLFHLSAEDRCHSPMSCSECGCGTFWERAARRKVRPAWPPIGVGVEFNWMGEPCWGVVTGTDSHGVKVLLEDGPSWTWLPRLGLLGKHVAFRVVSDHG